MAPINFDTLPDSNPASLPAKGKYYATIKKAEMKQPQDTTKPMYLNLQLALKDAQGRDAGTVFDIISESDHQLVRYKLKRFITALELPITGEFELRDLAKVVPNKQFIVDITHEEKDGRPPKAVVDIFTAEIYYPMSMASEIFGNSFADNADDDVPFFINESDATDANPSASPAADEEF